MSKQMVCRVAPSPTGLIHLGTARTGLYSFLAARQSGGTFIIRMEDTDKARSKQEFADNIIEGLAWLGITSDVPIVYQSQREEIYKAHVQKLLGEGKAYKCYCTPEELEKKRNKQIAEDLKTLYDRTCLGAPEKDAPYVVRLKTPDYGRIVWRDLVLGRIDVGAAELQDFIIQRTDGSVGYLLANVIDDATQGVTHVIRGIDGKENTPAQILLYEALGYPVPEFGHTPFILNEAGEKLSKRNGDASALEYRDKGYLPEAMVNWLVRIGWSHGNDEIFSMEDLIRKFSVKAISKHSGSMDMQKLEHINRHWLKVGDAARIAELVTPFLQKIGINPAGYPFKLEDVVKTLQPRSTTLVHMAEQAKAIYYVPARVEKSHNVIISLVRLAIDKVEPWEVEAVSTRLKDMMAERELTLKDVGPVIRTALTGLTTSPPIFEVLWALGKDEAVKRLTQAELK